MTSPLAPPQDGEGNLSTDLVWVSVAVAQTVTVANSPSHLGRGPELREDVKGGWGRGVGTTSPLAPPQDGEGNLSTDLVWVSVAVAQTVTVANSPSHLGRGPGGRSNPCGC
jgi:uncharacterized protein YejL (UPF0352 family)